MAEIGKKGFYPLFTTLGLLMVVMVVAVVVSWNNQELSDFEEHVDRMSWLKINHASNNVRMMASTSLRDLFYEAIVDVGKIKEGTVNPYLEYSKEDGWDMIVSDLKQSVSSEFKDVLPKLADYSDGRYNTFSFDGGVNITIGEITADDMSIVESEDGILAVVELPLTASNDYEGWEASISDSNLTIPLNVRLKDMYGRAWEFHNAYEETVRWTFSAAIYARSYYAAYAEDSGPFLKEAHYDFDPVSTILYGDLETLKDFGQNIGDTLDVGAVPAATWMVEWQHLSEPSFLPAGLDLNGGDRDRVKTALMNSYDMGEQEQAACEGFTGTELEACESLYDPETLEEEVAKLGEKRALYWDLYKETNDWLEDHNTSEYKECNDERTCDDIHDCGDYTDPDRREECKAKKRACEDEYEGYDKADFGEDRIGECKYNELDNLVGDMTCDEFRVETREFLTWVVEKFNESGEGECEGMIDDASREPADLDIPFKVKLEFFRNKDKYGFSQTSKDCEKPDSNVDEIKGLLKNDLTERDLSDSKCSGSGDCITNDECGYAGQCDDLSCSFATQSGGDSYECVGDVETGKKETDSCSDGRDVIYECELRCMVSKNLLQEIYKQLKGVRDYTKKTYNALDQSYTNLNKQLQAREKADELAESADSLQINDLGYDVFSRIEPIMVGYDKGIGGKMCYFNPTYKDKDSGVCGDSLESAGLYAVQVAAAALAAVFSGGAATPLLDYAKDFFPMIFETESRYRITEKIIDDGNRVMLTDVAKGGAELYTYAPFEFGIYDEHEVRIDSATLGRTIVYIYLKKVSLQRVMDGLADESCSGDSC